LKRLMPFFLAPFTRLKPGENERKLISIVELDGELNSLTASIELRGTSRNGWRPVATARGSVMG
jgi:hypothetical protein